MPSPGPIPPASPPPGWNTWRDVMDVALGEAFQAHSTGEVPIGAACISPDGTLLSTGHNAPLSRSDPTAHAEIQTLRRAAETTGNYRLTGCILAVTLEPCLMCFGAMVHARIGGLVIGSPDPKAGAILSRIKGPRLPFLNHRFWVLSGVLEDECSALLRRFFLQRRKDS